MSVRYVQDQAQLGAGIMGVRSKTSEAAFRIMLVEDDPDIASLLGETLLENGFVPVFASCSGELDKLLSQGNVDLIILDVMLPGENGVSICRRLRASSDIPILMLTALGTELDRILGLELGADDYITKPFNSRELVARIRAILRRAGRTSLLEGKRPRNLLFAGWRADLSERQLYNAEGVRVTTTSAEFDLLVALCRNTGKVLSRDQLLELTRGGMAGPIDRSIDVHISRIRQKIEPNPREPSLIKTVRLGGYQFTPKVNER